MRSHITEQLPKSIISKNFYINNKITFNLSQRRTVFFSSSYNVSLQYKNINKTEFLF